MRTAFIGIGSNVDPRRNIPLALSALARLSYARPDLSPLFLTEPWGDADQPRFVNAVVALRTPLRPDRLLRSLQRIEMRARRTRGARRFGPRTLDLDLLAVDRLQYSSSGLTLPHPRLKERRFVLAPWAKISPHFRVPGMGRIADLLARCNDSLTVKRLDATGVAFSSI